LELLLLEYGFLANDYEDDRSLDDDGSKGSSSLRSDLKGRRECCSGVGETFALHSDVMS
jgi:hypothetical protein